MGCGISSAVHPISSTNKSSLLTGCQCLDSDNFNLHQRRLVLRTWRYLAADVPGNGSIVFRRIFDIEPAVKQLFPCRDVPDSGLIHDPNFKGHASRFMQAVGAVVDNIEDPELQLSQLLLDMGRQHAYYKGFRPNYFDAFVGGMTYTWQLVLGEKFSGETKEAWIIVFNFIRCKMVTGYTMECDRKAAR